jgi:hypothetical protein
MRDRYDDTENAIHYLYDQLSTEKYKAVFSYTSALDFVMSYPKIPTEFIDSFSSDKVDDNFVVLTLSQIRTD